MKTILFFLAGLFWAVQANATSLKSPATLPGLPVAASPAELEAIKAAYATAPAYVHESNRAAKATAVAYPAPNILIFMLDDMGLGDLGRENHNIITPEIDSFFTQEGAVYFLRAYSQPNCSPARAALQTGYGAERCGMSDVGPSDSTALDVSFVTLGEMCKMRGYATSFYGKWHFSPFVSSYLPDTAAYGYSSGYFNNTTNTNPTENADYFVEDKFIPWLTAQEANDARPWLSVICPFEPHHPISYYTNPALGATDYKLEYDGIAPDYEDFWPLAFGFSFNGGTDPEDILDYWGCLTGVSHAFGSAIQALKDEGEFDNTLIIFTSDNGGASAVGSLPTNYYPFRDIEISGKKASVSEGGIRVPLMMLWKDGNIDTETEIDVPVCLWDIFPTISAILDSSDAGFASASQERLFRLKTRDLDGENILPIIEGDAASRENPIVVVYGAGRARRFGGELPSDGGQWSSGPVDSRTKRVTTAVISADGSRKIVYGWGDYDTLGHQQPHRWMERQVPNMATYTAYKFDDVTDTHPQNENPNLAQTATGADKADFDALLEYSRHYWQKVVDTRPYKPWYESGLEAKMLNNNVNEDDSED